MVHGFPGLSSVFIPHMRQICRWLIREMAFPCLSHFENIPLWILRMGFLGTSLLLNQLDAGRLWNKRAVRYLINVML